MQTNDLSCIDFSQMALEVFLNARLNESTSEYPSSDANARLLDFPAFIKSCASSLRSALQILR